MKPPYNNDGLITIIPFDVIKHSNGKSPLNGVYSWENQLLMWIFHDFSVAMLDYKRVKNSSSTNRGLTALAQLSIV